QGGDGLADRGPTDPEALRELPLGGQPITRLEALLDDELDEALDDLLEQRRTLDGREAAPTGLRRSGARADLEQGVEARDGRTAIGRHGAIMPPPRWRLQVPSWARWPGRWMAPRPGVGSRRWRARPR